MDAVERIRAHCLAKEGAFEDHPWGETVFKIAPEGRPTAGKVFCFCGSESPIVTLKATLEEQGALIQHPDIEAAKYVGRYGWVTMRVSDDESLELALDLIDRSYAMVAQPSKARRGKNLR